MILGAFPAKSKPRLFLKNFLFYMLEYSCLIMLQVHSRATQPHIRIFPGSLKLPFHSGCHKIPGTHSSWNDTALKSFAYSARQGQVTTLRSVLISECASSCPSLIEWLVCVAPHTYTSAGVLDNQMKEGWVSSQTHVSNSPSSSFRNCFRWL